MNKYNEALIHSSSRMVSSSVGSKLVVVAMFLYVHLWILEGLLRKLMPGANEVLYFGRDVLALVAILTAIACGKLRREHLLGIALAALVVVWTCLGAMSGTNPAMVWIVGVRSYIAPLLFAFLYAMTGSPSRMRSIRTVIIAQLPVQALIVVAQVTSPANSFWNMQTTGEEAHFLNDGIARASGTFSAPAGLFSFVLLAVALALSSILSSNAKEKWLPLLGLISAIGIGSLSGSRGTVLILVLLLSGFLYWVLTNGTFSRLLLVAFIAIVSAGLFVLVSVSFPQVIDAFGGRIQDASEHEDTTARVFFTLLGFVEGFESVLGVGAGNNSQAGIAVGAGGLWLENEGIRWVTELGVLGLGLAVVRLCFAFKVLASCVLRASYLSPQRFMLGLALAIVLLQGTITQNPSSQGAFSIMLALFLWCDDLRTPVARGTQNGRIYSSDNGLTRSGDK